MLESEIRFENASPSYREPARWLDLWHVSQGGAGRNRRLDLMCEVLPFGDLEAPRVLDMCCGPGDVGRAVRTRWPSARVDGVDREPLLLSLCAALNRTAAPTTRLYQRDGWRPDWNRGLGPYDAVLVATALHWFDVERLSDLFGEFHAMLRPGGHLVIHEPVSALEALRPGVEQWESRHGLIWDIEGTWSDFWDLAASELHYEAGDLEATPAGRDSIGDDGLAVEQYLALLRGAGFTGVDVLVRDGRTAVFAAAKANPA